MNWSDAFKGEPVARMKTSPKMFKTAVVKTNRPRATWTMNSTMLSSCKRGTAATNISVQFVSSSPLDLQIEHSMKSIRIKSTRSAAAIKETDEIIPRFSPQIDFDTPVDLPGKRN